ncbi:Metallo-hydrolase/oxidoreductase [Dothidotthia symphoricarpi CBS 119687]|uniref:Metallo-hydrolase/oxidoreductase n=1 Tax=Dothidotthia symphoricarpi CBS 119687 TaxID=1392245 RepID=A0A6A6ATN0_9PLEO|nr:Metallo-hydrolase/oxidoreductase [Dothidotthia symphoricarpi CBS 119687]KAF2134305.1 Metallo-hydrolase/oxidoreductase [Dothidotthia symphoricarpi CBS 119687]
MKHIQISPDTSGPPVKDQPSVPASLPDAKETKIHPANAPNAATNASLFFVGTATTILEWEGLRILTDPNFLHAGDHVHLGPGVNATRQTNPAIDLEELPRIDAILLSHYHEDHFDRKVEDKLSRSIPIITTPHAKDHLSNKGDESFTNVHALAVWDSLVLDIASPRANAQTPSVKITGTPGKHIPPGPLSIANDLLSAVPPTNGWMVELGYSDPASSSSFENGYRIYISGDTLMVDELKEIPERYKDQNIDLMLIHLGGTTIPGPKMPLLMVTMDAKQGVQLMQLVNPDLTIPIHYDDYDVFLSPLDDFKKAVHAAGLDGKVVYLDRKDQFRFNVKQDGKAKQTLQ